MPRTLVRARGHDRKRSLGRLACHWMEYFCVHGPGDVQGLPVVHGDEYFCFILDCYGLDPTGRLLYDSAFLSRPKGTDKSGLGSRFGLFEALGPARFGGWATGGEVYEDPWGLGFEHPYEPGEPMGRPVTVPYIRILATEEDQTGNVYDSIYYNLTDDDAPLSQVPGVNPGLTRVLLPGGGEITPSTAGSASKDGGKETWANFDESHLYNTPELRQMYRTVTRNMRKRKKIAGTWFLETTTMFAPGEESIAEGTYSYAEAIRIAQEDKKAKGAARTERLLYDHRWGECDDLGDEAELRKALIEAYGDALEWNDLDGLVSDFYDPRNPPQESRRYFLNAPTETLDAYLREFEWTGARNLEKKVADGDMVTLGFDGSRGRSRGVADSTALVGCRVRDGHLFQIAVWEQPQGAAGKGWQPPAAEVDAAIRDCFRRYQVVGFYADPARWESWVAQWEAEFGPRLKVGRREHPIEWWMTGGRSIVVERLLEKFQGAIAQKEISHDGSLILTQHALHARRRLRHNHLMVEKEHKDSPKKIDALVAALLAFGAYLDAVAKGLNLADTRYVPKRIR